MADLTHGKSIDRLKESIKLLSTSQSDLASKVDSILTQLATLIPTPSSPPRKHHLKLDVSRFNGADPIGWIFKISQFFEFHDTPEHQCLSVASFYMDGPTLSWYQWMYHNGLITSWSALLSFGVSFCSFILRSPLRCSIQAHPAWHSDKVPYRLRMSHKSHCWPPSPFSTQLLHFLSSTKNPLQGSSLTTNGLTTGNGPCKVTRGQVRGLLSFQLL